jgi:hypothetical protein
MYGTQRASGGNVIGIDSMEIETLQKGKGNMGG